MARKTANRFTNYYECTHEGRAQHGQPPTNWSDDSEAMNNDRCPVCNNEMEPVYSEDIETQQPAAAPMADERETAQWYYADAAGEGKAVIDALPEETRKRCYQYGAVAAWGKLPVEAREALRRKLAQNRAEAEAYEHKRDAPAFRFALHLDLSANDQPLTVIVSSLRDVAALVQSQALMFAQTRAIHDHNGENIGQWEVIEPEPAPAPGTTALRAELAALDALRDATAAVADAAERYMRHRNEIGSYDDRRALENAIAARKDARARAMASRPQSEAETVAAYDAANRATLKS